MYYFHTPELRVRSEVIKIAFINSYKADAQELNLNKCLLWLSDLGPILLTWIDFFLSMNEKLHTIWNHHEHHHHHHHHRRRHRRRRRRYTHHHHILDFNYPSYRDRSSLAALLHVPLPLQAFLSTTSSFPVVGITVGWNYSSLRKRQRCNHWSLGMHREFHLTLY